jgi:hypothetical protein
MEISEAVQSTRASRTDGVILAVMLQFTRGLLFIVFNWVLFIESSSIRNGPPIDFIAIVPVFNFFLLGFADIFMARKLWKRSITAWRYGVAASLFSILIAFLAFPSVFGRGYVAAGILLEIAGIFSVGELLALATSGARRFHRVTRTF